MRRSCLNTGGWLLLTFLFSVLLLIVQRSERKRRTVSLVIMLIVAFVIWRYATFRMENECAPLYPVLCSTAWNMLRNRIISNVTVTASIPTAFVINGLFWVMFGRSNPPGSSDDIKVIGMND